MADITFVIRVVRDLLRMPYMVAEMLSSASILTISFCYLSVVYVEFMIRTQVKVLVLKTSIQSSSTQFGGRSAVLLRQIYSNFHMNFHFLVASQQFMKFRGISLAAGQNIVLCFDLKCSHSAIIVRRLGLNRLPLINAYYFILQSQWLNL